MKVSKYLSAAFFVCIPLITSAETKIPEDPVHEFTSALNRYKSAEDIRSVDSVFTYFDRASEDVNHQKDFSALFEIQQKMAEWMDGTGNYAISIEYTLKNLALLENTPFYKSDTEKNEKIFWCYNQLGACYTAIEENKKSLTYFFAGLSVVEQLKKDTKKYHERKGKLLNNIGSAYLQDNLLDSAAFYYQQAILELKGAENNPVLSSSLYNNLGIIAKEKENFDEAALFYQKCLEIRTTTADSAGLAQGYYNLGNLFFIQNKSDQAEKNLLLSLEYSNRMFGLRTQRYATSTLAKLYYEKGDYKKAYLYQEQSRTISDQIMGSEKIQQANQLEISFRYEKYKLNQQLAVERYKGTISYYVVFTILLLVILIFSLFLYQFQRIRLNRQLLENKQIELESANLALSNENLLLEKKQLEMDLAFKNKELTTQVMYMAQKNEFINLIHAKVKSILPGLNSEAKQLVEEISDELKNKNSMKAWNDFEIHFQHVHTDFYNRLNEKYPGLTPGEIKLCAFLRMNMSSKDIASLTFQSLKSVEVARTRLRKKLDLPRDENLVAYLFRL